MNNVFKTLTTILVLMCSFIANAAWTVRYQHTDVQGSVIAESNIQGTITQRFDYKPFGEGTPTQKAGVGYTGHLEDTDLGLTYMQQRYYDPVIGRFYSNDPIDAESHLYTTNGIHGFNRYAYANNNPYRYIDPTGMNSQNVIPTYLQGKSAAEIGEMLKEEKSKPKNQQNKQKILDLQKAEKGLGVRNKQKRQNIRRGGGRGAALIVGLIVNLFADNEAEASENDDSTSEQNEQNEQNEEDREESPEPKEPPKNEEKI